MLSAVGSYVSARNPGFDTRDYGVGKLGDLVAKQPYVEVKEAGAGQLRVRLKG